MLAPLAFLAFLPAIAYGALDKGVAFPDGLHDPLIKLESLPSPKSTYKNIDPPKVCSDAAKAAKCDVSVLQARAVTYGDCGDAWTVCRCASANLEYVQFHIFPRLAFLVLIKSIYIALIL